MGLKEGFLFLLVLIISWTYTDARGLVTYDITVMPIEYKIPRSEGKVSETVGRHEQMCALCEEFTARATYFLGQNKSQTEIIDTLRRACSQLHSFEQQCVILVDFYANLFFVEISTIHPEEFCRKVNLCEETVYIPLPKSDDTCTVCHRVVVEVLAKLKDPDTQFGIIELLLKECNKIKHYVQECKRLVFQYGPLILVNGEKFLETTDICASIHACPASEAAAVGTAINADMYLLDRDLLDTDLLDV